MRINNLLPDEYSGGHGCSLKDSISSILKTAAVLFFLALPVIIAGIILLYFANDIADASRSLLEIEKVMG
ncbi:MAG TPA: hypothetical protein O0X39_02990 [Methanocorpusculum sp.]|nr:hypothetical protein [Methanocorpusculum sp.]